VTRVKIPINDLNGLLEHTLHQSIIDRDLSSEPDYESASGMVTKPMLAGEADPTGELYANCFTSAFRTNFLLDESAEVLIADPKGKGRARESPPRSDPSYEPSEADPTDDTNQWQGQSSTKMPTRGVKLKFNWGDYLSPDNSDVEVPEEQQADPAVDSDESSVEVVAHYPAPHQNDDEPAAVHDPAQDHWLPELLVDEDGAVGAGDEFDFYDEPEFIKRKAWDPCSEGYDPHSFHDQ
jgi:hypothetical protein